jgi:hypothetical protein
MTHFSKKEIHEALSFFELNRARLYKTIDPAIRIRLARAYVDTFQAERAQEFIDDLDFARDKDILRALVYRAESGKTPKSLKPLLASLHKRKWTFGASDRPQDYIHRILLKPVARTDLEWMSPLVRTLSQADKSLLCTLQLPVLQRQREMGMSTSMRQDLAHVVKTHFPNLLGIDHLCAMGFLDIEHESTDLKTLADLYLTARQSWPIAENLVNLVWVLAEDVQAVGDHSLARKLYQLVRQKAPPGSLTARLATERLDRTRTEFDKLWH